MRRAAGKTLRDGEPRRRPAPGRTALAATILSCAVAHAPAQAAVDVTNGPVAFEQGPGPSAAIGRANPDGTDLRSALVAAGPTDRDPAFDATGTRLALTSTRTGDEEIWVAAADGSGPANVSRHPARDNDPAWSPDGRIAFTSTRAGAPHVFVMDADGAGVRQLTDGESTDQQPSWSPDGTEIVFASDRAGTRQLFVVDVASGVVRRLTGGAEPKADPAWGPEGAIAFTAGEVGAQRIHRLDPDGEQRRLTEGPWDEHFPRWSPDGTQIAYTGYDAIRVMRADGEPALLFTGFPPGTRDAAWGRLPAVPPTARPTQGETFIVAPGADGVAAVRTGETSVDSVLPSEVRGPVAVPADALGVDVRQGAVTVRVATGAEAADTTTARLSGGRFSVRQPSAGAAPVFTFRGPRAGCGGAAAARLLQRQRGTFRGRSTARARTKRGYVPGGAKGTRWTLVRGCRGIRFSVGEGSITVTLRRGMTWRRDDVVRTVRRPARTITVRAGEPGVFVRD